MIDCMSRDVGSQFSLRCMLHLRDLSALSRSCSHWQRWIAHPTVADGEAQRELRCHYSKAVGACQSTLVQRLCTSLDVFQSLFPPARERPLFDVLPLLPRLTALSVDLSYAGVKEHANLLRGCCRQLSPRLRRFVLRPHGPDREQLLRFLLLNCLEHLQGLRELEIQGRPRCVPIERLEEVELYPLKSLPLLERFVFDARLYAQPIHPEHAAVLAECKQLREISCGT